MFINIAKDDNNYRPHKTIICSECGQLTSVFSHEREHEHKGFRYIVLENPLRCKKCGHTDDIVAANKGSYIDMELFLGEYNLDIIREEEKKKRSQKKREESKKKETKIRNRKSSAWRQYLKRLFLIDPSEPIISQIKEKLSELGRLGVISLLIIFILGLVFVLTVSIIILSLMFIILFIGLYYLMGLFTTSMALKIYIAATVVFSIFEIMRPYVGKKESLLLRIISWPIIVYNSTEFPYIFQFIVLFVVTVINLGDFQLTSDNLLWDTISRSLYPAIVTSILLREITDRHQYKSLNISKKELESECAEQIKKTEWIEEQQEKNKVVDALYIEVLKCYFEQTTLNELEQYFPNIYRLVNNDFSSVINDLNAIERRSISIANIVERYCDLNDEDIICLE